MAQAISAPATFTLGFSSSLVATMGDDSETEEITDLSNPDVTTKYRLSSDIAQKALQKVIEACVVDADIATVCEMGDKVMEDETGKLFNKKDKSGNKMGKGVAFPTCISVNELVGYYCPFKGESTKLKAGDVCKIDMACHIDGFVGAVGHTVIVGDEAEITDRRADVILAAYNAAEVAIRLLQAGNTNTMTTDAFTKVCEDFNSKFIQGELSHEMKKHVMEGQETIFGTTEGHDEKIEEVTFEVNEVYCIDVVVSSGDGKVKETELRSTVFKRAVEKSYILKLQKARQFIHEVTKTFPALPFTLRAFEDETVARVGVVEAKRHALLDEYRITSAKSGCFVAKFRFTALILPGGTKKVTGLPLGDLEAKLKSSLSVKDEDMVKLLKTSTNPKKQKKKKAAAGDAK